jgi:predicted nuclease of predicted toxin-antitoxin system
MIFWLGAQFSPLLAPWLTARFGVTVHALRDIDLRDATDRAIFDAARSAGATVITKDRDFAELVGRLDSPPQIVWVTCGNTSNARMQQVFDATFVQAMQLLATGDALVEIRDTL